LFCDMQTYIRLSIYIFINTDVRAYERMNL